MEWEYDYVDEYMMVTISSGGIWEDLLTRQQTFKLRTENIKYFTDQRSLDLNHEVGALSCTKLHKGKQRRSDVKS